MSILSFLTLVFFCLACFVTFSHAINNGFSVELIHRDSFKSPFYNPRETNFQRTFNFIHRSTNRVNYLKKEFSDKKNKPVSNVTEANTEYFMTYSVGTPPFKIYGVLDTGSSFIWFQCKPCPKCVNQTSDIYNPLKSSSHKNIHCSSRKCKSDLSIVLSCSHNKDICEYTANYGSVSSKGDLMMETLTLDSTSNSSVSFPKIIMGCGHTKDPYASGHRSGIVGLGDGKFSLLKQLGPSIGGKFSYCLISPYSSQSNSSSKLNFGDAAVVSGEGVVSTPFVKSQLGYYLLTLEALSVGNKRIEYGGFKDIGTKNASTKSILIDSGTNMIFLPQQVYTSLESAVTELITLKRFHDPEYKSFLCYNTTSKHSDLPAITAHFSGADVVLNSDHTFLPHPNYHGVVCFFVFPSEGFGVFGNIGQYNMLVGYDLKKNIVSFKPTDCTKH